MANCWYCGIELKSIVNTSKEHIIPDALGGRLTSYDLLCKEHNASLGNTLDAGLYTQLAPFLKLINPIRDRPNDSFLALIAEDGELTERRSGFKQYYPVEIIFPPQKTIAKNFKNRDEADAFLRKKAGEFDRKGKAYKISHIHKEPSTSNLFVSNQVGTNRNIIGGKPILKALGKIIVNYYLFRGGKREIIEQFIDAVKNADNDVISKFARMYYTDLPFHELSENEMSHIIYIKGDNLKKVFVAYVEILNFVNALFVIDTNYTGESFEYQYCYDLIKSNSFKKEIIINKPRDFFLHFPILRFGSNHYLSQSLFNRFILLLGNNQDVFRNR